MNDDRDRALVERWLHEVAGLVLVAIPTTRSKTPDYVLAWPDGSQMHAELKTLTYQRASTERGWAIQKSGNCTSAHRPDNAPARIARHVMKAHEQLKQLARPWCVIFLNRDPMIDRLDFRAFCTGTTEYASDDGQLRLTETSARRVALGESRCVRYAIDLYLWLDMEDGVRLGAWWSTPEGERVARQFLAPVAGQPWPGVQPYYQS